MYDCDFLLHYFYLGHLCVEDTFCCGKMCKLAVSLGARVYASLWFKDTHIDYFPLRHLSLKLDFRIL